MAKWIARASGAEFELNIGQLTAILTLNFGTTANGDWLLTAEPFFTYRQINDCDDDRAKEKAVELIDDAIRTLHRRWKTFMRDG